MALSKAEYILFLDADDYLHPEALYHLYNTVTTSNCNNVFVYSDWFEAETGERKESPDFNPKLVFDKLANPVRSCTKSGTYEEQRTWEVRVHQGGRIGLSIQVAAKAGLCGVRVKGLTPYRLKSGTLREQAAEPKRR